MKKFFTKEWWTIMKIGVTQLFLALSLCGVSLAHNNYAQVLDQKITIHVTEASLEATVQQIADATNVFFSYSPDLISIRDRITLHADDKSLRTILYELLAPHRITYSLHQDGTTIFLKPSDNRQQESQSTLNTKPPAPAWLQITGTVRDAQTQPIAGVNVLVKGTTNGTTSDINGNYIINVEVDDIIVFSFIGYTSQEVSVTQQTSIDVILQEDVKSLNEVIVNVGYWEVKEKEQTGSVARVTSAQIEKQPINNPLQAMQGRMPGVYIQQNTGMPGGGFTVQIRGRNSLRNGINGNSNGNLPLYLIDGIPFTSSSLTSGGITSGNISGGNPLATINPGDIESIEVLKDADATAIYGSRGANGVILITTKRAKQGKGMLSVDFSQGIGKVTRFMDLLNTDQYLTMRKEAITNDGYDSFLTDPEFKSYWPDIALWDANRQTNWQKELMGGSAQLSNAQVSFSGGNQQTQYLIGGGYYRETTVFPGSNSFQRASGRMTINHTSFDKKFNIIGAVNYSASFSSIPVVDFTATAISLAPNAPALYDQHGELNWEGGTWNNPLADLKRKYTNTIANFATNLSTSYEILNGLRTKINVGYTTMNVDEISISPLSAYNPSFLTGLTGSSGFGDSNIKTWIAEPQLDYVKTIADGTLTFLVGGTFQESIQEGRSLSATGYTSDALLKNLAAAARITISNASYAQYRYEALFSRLNYNLNGKYIINLTARRDGSSRFGSGKQFANFGAVGAAWIFSSESFLSDNVNFVSFGKIRTSFGLTGSDAIGNYQYLNTYSTTRYPYNGSSGLAQTRLTNPDYSWETNQKLEAAIDLGFWKDRINTTVAFYQNRSGNQLVGLPLPAMTGQSSIQYNLPALVENKGWEFQLSTSNITNDFQWTTSINATLPSNKIVRFPDLENFPSYVNRYDVGKSLFAYKGYQYAGVNPETGVYNFSDQNGDQQITAQDLVIRKNRTQTAFGGINNTFKYKGFELDIFVQFVKQTGLSYQFSFDLPGTQFNQPTEVMKRWQKSGDQSAIEKFSAFDLNGDISAAYSNTLFSDRAIVDASFIRLKNVSLSWSLPQKWLSKSKLQSARIYLQGQNLLTFTNYLGLDPETQSNANLPALTMITAGLQIKL